MKRMLGVLGALILVFALIVPVVAAADPHAAEGGRVLVSTDGPIDVPAGEHVDALLVVNGSATIEGEVESIVAIESTLMLSGAKADTIVAVRTPVTLGAGTVVSGDVVRFDSQVHQVGDAEVGGSIRDFAVDLVALGFVVGPIALLLYVGFALAAIAGGLLLAALAARQVRAAEALISREPGQTVVAALAGIFLPILLIVALFVTVIGAPLAVALLVGVWPLVAVAGYLVAGIWIGDWILRRTSPGVERERPYLAAVIGIAILEVVGLWPFLSMIASLFGYGAVVLLAWRTFRGGHGSRRLAVTPAPAGA
ncbi:MAG TPA: hypothetical protein VFM38_14100 [Candidatus Limnocylindrales bacterium]|nr:hypothetical protein [Candidatus Limnocylindrales bacterium]